MKKLLIIPIVLILIAALLFGLYKAGIIKPFVSKLEKETNIALVKMKLKPIFKDKQVSKLNNTTEENFVEYNPDSEYFKAVDSGDNSNLSNIFNTTKDSIDVRDRLQETPLMHSFESNNMQAFDILMGDGANINAQDINGQTVAMMAAKTMQNDILNKILYDYQADTNIQDKNGRTVLSYALLFNNFGAIKSIIDQGGDISHQDSLGNTAMSYAVENNAPLKVIKELVDNGADINSPNFAGDTPLMLAAKNGNLDIVRYLIMLNAKVNLKSISGDTALSYARKFNHDNVVAFLTYIGAEDTKN